MINKKICMVGAFAAGKTSLVAHFVKNLYSENYQTTVGVKIDKKSVNLADRPVNLILWDIQGEDDSQALRISYLRGLSGYVLVVDGTRHTTLEKAFELQQCIEQVVGKVPFILILNKSDLTEEWEIDATAMDKILKKGWTVIQGSAKTGLSVEEAFMTLTKKMLN